MKYVIPSSFFVKALCGCLLLIASVSCGSKSTNRNAATTVEHRPDRQVVSLSDSLLNDRGADTIRMGRMRSGETVVKELTLRNDGDTPFVIIGLEKTCDCLDLKYPREPLKPGEEGTLELSFDSKRLTGWTYKTIGIRTSLGTKSHILVVTADIGQ